MKPSSSLVFSVSINSSSTVESSLTLTSPLLSTPIRFIIKFWGFYPRTVSYLSFHSASTVLVVGQEMVFKPVPADEILTSRSVKLVMILKGSVYISRSLYIAFSNCHKDLPFLAFLSKSSYTHLRKDQPSPVWNSAVVLSRCKKLKDTTEPMQKRKRKKFKGRSTSFNGQLKSIYKGQESRWIVAPSPQGPANTAGRGVYTKYLTWPMCLVGCVLDMDSPGNLDPPGPRLSLGPQAYSPHTPNLTSTPRLLQYPDFISYSDAPFSAPRGKWAPSASPPTPPHPGF